MPHDVRDEVVDYVFLWTKKTKIPAKKFVKWLGISESKYYGWIQRYGKANEHNAEVPRDFWLEPEERKAILEYHSRHPLDGYRRLSFMMIDEGVVCVSPSTVYRVLKEAGVIDRRKLKPSKKGTGFHQPSAAHHHWHIDVSYINVGGTFYFLVSVLDGFSRAILAWDLKPSMPETEIEKTIEKARTIYPGVTPRIISDRGPQFVSKEFKEYIRLVHMSHALTAPYYPQSNGKIERYHRTLKESAIKTNSLSDVEKAIEIISKFIEEYYTVRLHSAIDYVTPMDKLTGKSMQVLKTRDERLEKARDERKIKRAMKSASACNDVPKILANAVS